MTHLLRQKSADGQSPLPPILGFACCKRQHVGGVATFVSQDVTGRSFRLFANSAVVFAVCAVCATCSLQPCCLQPCSARCSLQPADLRPAACCLQPWSAQPAACSFAMCNLPPAALQPAALQPAALQDCNLDWCRKDRQLIRTEESTTRTNVGLRHPSLLQPRSPAASRLGRRHWPKASKFDSEKRPCQLL